MVGSIVFVDCSWNRVVSIITVDLTTFDDKQTLKNALVVSIECRWIYYSSAHSGCEVCCLPYQTVFVIMDSFINGQLIRSRHSTLNLIVS